MAIVRSIALQNAHLVLIDTILQGLVLLLITIGFMAALRRWSAASLHRVCRSRILSFCLASVVLRLALLWFGPQVEQSALAQDPVEQTKVADDSENQAKAAEKNAIEWLRGQGKGLEMRLRGEVFEANGQPATDIKVTGHLNSQMGQPKLNSVIDGNRFEIWIPANEPHWYSMQLSAASMQNDAVAYLMISAPDLRQTIVNGAKLTLKKPTRQVKIKVVDNGQPVSGATVKAEIGYGVELRSRTDDQGIAHFQLLHERQLDRLTAWTDDFRIGGYSFDRSPVRDPTFDEHPVELSPCRNQRIRFVDPAGAPVPGIDFVLQVATAPPNYNFIGTNEHSVMTTDANGEAIDQWFPDWEGHYFYPELRTDRWVIDGDTNQGIKIIDGLATIKLKKSKIDDRKRVTGRVKSSRSRVGGFRVHLNSFQGEQVRHSDMLGAFTDADGTFSANVLPDATYCMFVLDGRWVSEIIDSVPYESETDRLNSPILKVSEGQDVEVIVTSGPDERPYPHLGILFMRKHMFKFRRDGKMENGQGGPQWWVTTDETGRAMTHTLPGELRVASYTPQWREEKKVTVKEGEPVQVHLHREVDEKQAVKGRLILPEGMQTSLKGAQIKVSSIDGTSRDEKSITCDEDGRFAFEILASQVGIFAKTKDGKVAGSLMVNDLSVPIDLPLFETVELQGQLLSASGDPIVGHTIKAVARIERKKKDVEAVFANIVDVQHVEVMTDEAGIYKFKGLPVGMRIMVWTNALDDSSQDQYLEDVVLQSNEPRPREVHRLGRKLVEPKKIPLAKRYQTTLRDCALSGYHLMVIVEDSTPSVTAFVDKHLKDYESNKEVSSFMQIEVSDQPALELADADFMKEKNWQQPAKGRVFAYAIDGQGKELGRLEISIADQGAAEFAASFVHQHMPAISDAEKKWDEAFAEAKRSNRRVWARVSQRYCGPCFQLTRWLDDQREALAKDYVMLKIDDFQDTNGERVAERLTRGTQHGVPFSAIFDASGDLLIDSAGPLGNIGFPSDFEGSRQLRQMLVKSRTNLTDSEIEKLVESVAPQTGDANRR